MAHVLPPGPKSAFLQMLHFLTSSDVMADLPEMARKYGDPMSIPGPKGQMVVTWGPAGVKQIFSADPDTFLPSSDSVLAPIVGQGSIFMLGGAAHRRARKLLSPPFVGERMRAYGKRMAEAAVRWASQWVPGRPFTILETMQAITLDVIIEAIFGILRGEDVTKTHKMVVDTFHSLSIPIAAFPALRREFGGFGPWARFQRHHSALRSMVLAEIEKARTSGEGREDILALLVKARDEEGAGLTDQEVFEQLLTMLVAGHETTAVTLSWAFYELYRQPEAREKLIAEVLSLGPNPEPEQLARLPWLDAVCQETLRLYPVLGIMMRKLGRSFTLGGYDLPEGTYVGVIPYLSHRREELFPEPDRFLPERFLGKTFTPFEYLPWGGGLRRCLGAPFALYEMKVVLGTLVPRFRLELLEKKPVGMALRAATLGPRGGVKMVLKEAASAA